MLDAARLEHAAQCSGGIIAEPLSATASTTAMSHVITAPPAVSIPVAGGGTYPVRRIYCVGRNYAEHAQEMGFTGREPPFFFMKPADAVVPVADGETGSMPYPTLTANLHHEIELVVAIGTGGAGIKAADAASHIWGYAVGLDMTRRDLQGEMKKQGRPWCIGKAFDHSAPIGPLHAKSRTGELTAGAITLAVNGAGRQKGDLKELIWNVNETIEHLSAAWELAPGDLIFTGTPAGVGAVVKGDVMEGFIAGLGTLRVAVR
jgi:fumarylpyruvate hydrolase